MRFVCSLAAVLFLAAALPVFPQTEAKKPLPRVAGEVTAVDAPAGKITLKPDNGGAATISVTDQTRILRVPEGEKDPRKFTKIALSDIAAGDRVSARGQLEGQALTATAILVMSKGDLAQKRQQERSEWQTRGVSGTIVNLDPATKEITIAARSREGRKPVLVDVSAKTEYRRYAPNSVRSSDALPSSWDALKIGDEFHALGDKSADGAHVAAEQIYSGEFETIAATVVSVDPAANTVHVAELPGKRPVTVHTTPDTLLRRLPQQMAAMMAMRMRGGPNGQAADGQGASGQHGAESYRASTPQQGGASAGARGSGNFDLRQLLERMPPVTLAELKPGDALILSSSKGNDPANITAIRLIAGVEPFLAAAPRGNSGEVNLGAWSMDTSMPGE